MTYDIAMSAYSILMKFNTVRFRGVSTNTSEHICVFICLLICNILGHYTDTVLEAWHLFSDDDVGAMLFRFTNNLVIFFT